MALSQIQNRTRGPSQEYLLLDYMHPDFPDDHLVYALRSFDKVLRSMT
jgi:hypothetical protein